MRSRTTRAEPLHADQREPNRRFVDAVSLDLPWSLVEVRDHASLAAGGREQGRPMIWWQAAGAGVPVEVQQPEIYLSIPLSAASVPAAVGSPRQAAVVVAVGAGRA